MLRTAVSAIILSFALTAAVLQPSLPAGASATAWTELHGARVRLVGSPSRTADGHYLGGLEIVLEDGWKTYWRMPGDSGVPPTFDWNGSVNLAVAKVLYPAPVRMPEAGGVAVGYKHSVLLPIEITPKDLSKPVELKLALEFGVCREICIPATAEFNLSMPVAGVGPIKPEIAAAIERVPRPQQSRRKGDPALKHVAVVSEGGSSKLVMDASFAGDAKGADVFIEAPESLYVPVPKRVAVDGGALRFETVLGRDLAQDLKGKTLTFTLVSATGATEAQWAFP